MGFASGITQLGGGGNGGVAGAENGLTLGPDKIIRLGGDIIQPTHFPASSTAGLFFFTENADVLPEPHSFSVYGRTRGGIALGQYTLSRNKNVAVGYNSSADSPNYIQCAFGINARAHNSNNAVAIASSTNPAGGGSMNNTVNNSVGIGVHVPGVNERPQILVTETGTSIGAFHYILPNPSAFLHLGPGGEDAGQAPLKFSPGTLLEYPENGAVEHSGGSLYFTSSQRKKILTQKETFELIGGASQNVIEFNVNGSSIYIDYSAGGTTAAGFFSEKTSSPSIYSLIYTESGAVVSAGIGVYGTGNEIGLFVSEQGVRHEGRIGFFGTLPVVKKTVTGSGTTDDKVTELLSALSSYGLIGII